MKPELQRIKIAEACGFRWFAWINYRISIPISMSDYDKATYQALPSARFLALWDDAHPHPKSSTQCFTEEEFALPIDSEGFALVPDYLNSLDAIHEAEMWLKNDLRTHDGTQFYNYTSRLAKDYGPCATASQRAEAFLRTIGELEATP